MFVKSLYLLSMGFSILTLTTSSKEDICTVFPILPMKGLKLNTIRSLGQGHMAKNWQSQWRQGCKAVSYFAAWERELWSLLPQRWNSAIKSRCLGMNP